MKQKLTLGSVVVVGVEQQEFEIMIVAKDLSNPKGVLIDYMGVVYPYGYVKGTDFVYFNQDLIKQVLHHSQYDKAAIFYDNLAENILKEIDAKRNIPSRD